jgi:lipoprotein-releasing system ATP-binding protein
MSEAMLRLTGIEKTYNKGQTGEVQVLAGADLTLAKGEMVALVAPSGAGKSTLLHIAGLLDVADTGRVEIGGEDMSGLSDRRRTAMRRQEVGFVYQFHHLLPEFSALENIVLPQLANGVARKAAQARAQELLEQVGVGARAGHRPSAMSGGEQQRVAFCRALANSPGVRGADRVGARDRPFGADCHA